MSTNSSQLSPERLFQTNQQWQNDLQRMGTDTETATSAAPMHSGPEASLSFALVDCGEANEEQTSPLYPTNLRIGTGFMNRYISVRTPIHRTPTQGI
jgi:hypothetical protein